MVLVRHLSEHSHYYKQDTGLFSLQDIVMTSTTILSSSFIYNVIIFRVPKVQLIRGVC